VSLSPKFEIGQASKLFGKSPRWKRGDRTLFPRRKSCPKIPRRKSRSEFVRYADGPGVSAIEREHAGDQDQWRTAATRQAGRVARVGCDRKNHRGTRSQRF